MSKLGIVVVNYNNLDYTINCVDDLRKQINQDFELWVIDQNSKEENTDDYLNKLYGENIKVVRNSTNMDLNRVWNYFFDECKSEYLCFLNNDIRLTNNFTDDIIKIFGVEPSVGAVIHVTNNLKFTSPKYNLDYEILNPPLYQGWDFTLKREAFTRIPNTLRIFGGDDFVFGHLNKRGYKTALTYSSPIIHYKERTRINIGNEIHEIQKHDIQNYHIQMKKDGYHHTNSTMNSDKCNKYPPQGIQLTQRPNCIYTTIIGDYDNLPIIATPKESEWDYICFSDNKKLKSKDWKIIYVPESNGTSLGNSKLSRYYKTNFHKYLLSYENIIYTDARMKIIGNISTYLGGLGDNDFCFLKHPAANSIKEEMERVSGGLEKKEVIDKIKKKYSVAHYKYDNGLFAGGILLFKNNDRTIKFFSDWWNEINELSHRDQLSLNYVLTKNPDLKYKTVKFTEVISKYFQQTPRISKRLTF